MAKIIEFYVPSNFRKNLKWTPVQERGRLIEFSLVTKRSLADSYFSKAATSAE